METQPGRYEFAGGYPTPETIQRAYDEADLNRAVQAYRLGAGEPGCRAVQRHGGQRVVVQDRG